MSIDRRSWLKQSSLMVAGLGLSPMLSSAEERKFLPPAGPIWLNSNENAYGPSEATKRAMSEALTNSNRYPDDKIPVLKQQVADFWQIGKENILFGAGSSEILGLTSILVSSIKGTVITAEPSYRVWNGQAETAGLQFKRVPLATDRTLDLKGMMSSLTNDTRMVYVCNLNNPVGTYVDDHFLRAFVDESSKKCMVLLDEAYTEFGEVPSLKDIAIKNPNVIVAKTFSKIYGLAGAIFKMGKNIFIEKTMGVRY